MRYISILLFAVAVFLNGCGSTDQSNSDPSKQKRYELRGKVVEVDKIKKSAKIDHETIPGFMEKMTMDFPIHENWVWEDLQPGVEIRAELVVDSSAKDPYWLEKVSIVANSIPGQQPVVENTPEQVGKDVPPLTLTDQNGKKIKLTDYKGKALAVTFIYRECPLPEFCIKMSSHFADIANRIAEDPVAKDKVRLLSISFDPERDTPEKLKSYGLGYLGKDAKDDLTVWNLAVGTDAEVKAVADFFGLKYEVDPNNKTQINHSLVTAVISPEGKVTKVFAGGRWIPDDVMAELKAQAAK